MVNRTGILIGSMFIFDSAITSEIGNPNLLSDSQLYDKPDGQGASLDRREQNSKGVILGKPQNAARPHCSPKLVFDNWQYKELRVSLRIAINYIGSSVGTLADLRQRYFYP